MKRKVYSKELISLAVIFVFFAVLGIPTFVSALTYQQEIGVNFTFNPALNLTVSADLYINNLAPGAASDSNVIDVVVATNAINGYTLTANVGNNTTYNTRNLVHSNSNLSNTFTSIAYSATPTITTNTNLSADTWGFSYSTNNGSTWSNYNGLPLYSDTTNVATLKETTGPVSSASGDDVKFKIAAKASASQVSGAYNNVINFNLAANVVPQYTVQFNAGDGSGTMPSQTIFRDEATMLAPNSFTPPSSGLIFLGWNTAADGSGTSYTNQESVTNIAADGGTITLYAQWGVYMQDLILSDCQKNVGTNGNYASIGDTIKVADRRDGSIYKARYIGGQCFMTSNLKISGTISATDSNFTGQDFNVSENSLCTGVDRYSNACTSGTGYNFYAASAGTVSTNSNTNVPTGDICPAGWRLITNSDLTLLESIGPETYGSAGLWALMSFTRVWAADSTTATDRVVLYYDNTAGDFYKVSASRVNLYSVRCTYIEEIYN